MASPLVVCPSCSRHVRMHETRCPFCAHGVPAGLVPAPRGPKRPYVGKGATALALASALATTACGDGSTSTPSDAAIADTTSDAAADATSDAAAEAQVDAANEAASDASDGEVNDDGASFPLYK